jgi:hypothetical protein
MRVVGTINMMPSKRAAARLIPRAANSAGRRRFGLRGSPNMTKPFDPIESRDGFRAELTHEQATRYLRTHPNKRVHYVSRDSAGDTIAHACRLDETGDLVLVQPVDPEHPSAPTDVMYRLGVG